MLSSSVVLGLTFINDVGILKIELCANVNLQHALCHGYTLLIYRDQEVTITEKGEQPLIMHG